MPVAQDKKLSSLYISTHFLFGGDFFYKTMVMISLIPTAFVLIVATVDISWAKLVTIDNNAPRLDVHGNIIDAHDGTIQVHTDF